MDTREKGWAEATEDRFLKVSDIAHMLRMDKRNVRKLLYREGLAIKIGGRLYVRMSDWNGYLKKRRVGKNNQK